MASGASSAFRGGASIDRDELPASVVAAARFEAKYSADEIKAAGDTLSLMTQKVSGRSFKVVGDAPPPAPQPSHVVKGIVSAEEYRMRSAHAAGVASPNELYGPIGAKSDHEVQPHDVLIRRVVRNSRGSALQTPGYPYPEVFATVNGLLKDGEYAFAGIAIIPRDGSHNKDNTISYQVSGEEHVRNTGGLTISAGDLIYLDLEPYCRKDDTGVTVSTIIISEETKTRLLPALYPYGELSVNAAIRMVEQKVREVIDDGEFYGLLVKWKDEKATSGIERNLAFKNILETVTRTSAMFRTVGPPRPLQIYGLWLALNEIISKLNTHFSGTHPEENVLTYMSAIGAIYLYIELLFSPTSKKLLVGPFVVDDRADKILQNYARKLSSGSIERDDIDGLAILTRQVQLCMSNACDDHRALIRLRIIGKALEDAVSGQKFKILLGYNPAC